MHILLDIYTAFLSLILIGLIVLNMLPREVEVYPAPERYPSVLLIVPCRGMDITLRQNLLSLKRQRYRNFRLVAVVDSEDDKALTVIKGLRIDHIISSYSSRGSGKVRALATAISRFRGYDAYAVADSDIVAPREWLARLAAPLSDGRVGVSTAFPYFRSLGGAWSDVKEVWGFVGEGLMESERTRFVWGGSFAFRKGLLDRRSLRLFGASISDDIAITRICRAKGLSIAYVRGAQPTINIRESLAQFIEWSNRQTAFSISGYRANLYYGLAFYTANILLLVSGIALSAISPLFLVLLLPFILGLARTYRRERTKKLGTIPIYALINFIYLANLAVASRTREVEWRGRRYTL